MASTIINGLKLATGIVSNVGDEWQTVRLPYWYRAMVIVATPCYDAQKSGAVVRIRNANPKGQTFEMRVYNPKGEPASGYIVNYVAVEAGVYSKNGIKVEALHFDSTDVDHTGSWRGQTLNLQSTFTNPVVLGQVMTVNDEWCVFWSKKDGNGIKVGRHIGAEPRFKIIKFFNTETLGIIVVEAGSGEINGIQFEASNTPIAVYGRKINGETYKAPLNMQALTAVASPASMYGSDGYWTTLWGDSQSAPFNNNEIALVADEDQITDVEQFHRTEIVGYLALNGQKDAARFLQQAGFGGYFDELNEVGTMGYAAWIDAQKEKPRSLTRPYMESLIAYSDMLGTIDDYTDEEWIEIRNSYPFEVSFRDGSAPYAKNFLSIWMRNIVHNEDQLRQRVTFALSQILVVSVKGSGIKLTHAGRCIADYYDTLSKHALGNFRDLLLDISKHPAMAYYLSSLGNQKASDDGTYQPDENYARELMQLFSIGLWELKQSGAQKLDGNGEPIPTYDNQDVVELARVFTGLWFKDRPFGQWADTTPLTVEEQNYYLMQNLGHQYDQRPLVMFEDRHDQAPKTLFHGKSWETTLPANNGGMQDIEDAIDVIFNHPNVAPFIARRLIQFLVTSDPHPNYINRVAKVFRDNGQGVRGDMHAVVKQILLDGQARYFVDPQAGYVFNPKAYGKLTEPMIRLTRLVKAFRAGRTSPDLVFWSSTAVDNAFGQWPMHSPSVFNFFSPDYEAGGVLVDERNDGQNLSTPEFQILNPTTAISLPNRLQLIIDKGLVSDIQNFRPDVTPEFNFDFTDEIAIAHDVEQLLDRLDILLTDGQMSAQTRTIIQQGVEQLPSDTESQRRNRVKLAVWLVAVSPDGAVTR